MAEVTKKAKGSKRSGKLEPIYEELAKKIKGYVPDYFPRLVKEVFPMEDAKIAMELPAPAEEIARKLHLDVKAVEKKLDKMLRKGALIKTEKDIRFPWFLEQWGDIMNANPFFDHERSEEYWELMRKWSSDEKSKEENAKILFQMRGEKIDASLRVIPRWKAIKDIPGIMPCEDVREILKEGEKKGKLNLTRCPCRTVTRSENCTVDEGTVPWEGDCVHFGALAKYYSEVLKCTPYLTAEYVQAHLDRQEKLPFYHMAPDFRVVGALCQCCECDCHARMMDEIIIKKYKSPSIKPSRFLSVVNSNKCTAKTGCKACISLCPWNALQLEGGTVEIDADKCMGCGVCVLNCPDEALKLKIVRPPEHIPVGGDQDIFYKIFTTPLDE